MPTVIISTLCEDGMTTLGSYSLVFPYYIAGKDSYAMLLECRNSSNTAQNILKNGKCALNFIKDDRKYFKEAVRLGFPGKTPAEKMDGCNFELIKGQAEGNRPLIPVPYYGALLFNRRTKQEWTVLPQRRPGRLPWAIFPCTLITMKVP